MRVTLLPGTRSPGLESSHASDDHAGSGVTTIHDVAVAAKVSAATVSRVLNGTAEVSPELRKRVSEAIDRLGYRPNSVARSLRRRRTAVWGLVISDIENPFFTAMVRGVEDIAQASGFSVVLCNSDEDLAKEARYIEVLVDERMAGAIVSPASEQDSDVSPLLEQGIPVVSIDRRLRRQDVDAVLADNRLGAERATAHLLATGRRRVACIGGLARTTTGQERTEGYRRARAAAGVSDDPELVVEGDFKHDSGHDAMLRLLSLADPPDGVFVANNLMSLGAVEALREAGIDVPGTLAMAMFDDPAWAALVRPAITAVSQPTYAMGAEAAGLLCARILGDDGPTRRVVLAPSLRVRGSTVRDSRVTLEGAPPPAVG